MVDIVGRKRYVENLDHCLSAFEDFDSIKYAWSAVSGGEYVKLTNRLNGAVFFNVKGLTKAEIFKEVARYVLSGEVRDSVPVCLVMGHSERLAVDTLFRK